MNEYEARERIEAALKMLRWAFDDYRTLFGNQVPLFYLDRFPATVPAVALAPCKVFSDRESLVQTLPCGGRIAEVGTQRGNWAWHLLQTKSPVELHLFDLSFDILRDEVCSHPNVRLHCGDSSTMLETVEDKYFDWIYIDGDHTYDGVKKDANVAIRKIHPDGILVFNDYILWSYAECMPYGVVPCVNELLCSGDWEAAGIALTPHGYFDIAIRLTAEAKNRAVPD